MRHRTGSIRWWPGVLGLVLVLCLYAGLSMFSTQEPEPHSPYIRNLFNFPNQAVDVWVYPPKLAVDRAYRRKYPQEDFAFRFVTSEGFAIDTFTATVTKDMGTKPDTTIALPLTEVELNEIYKTILSTHFFDLPEPHPPYGADGPCFPEHPHSGHGTIELTVRSGSQYKMLKWDSRRKVGPIEMDNWKRLWRVAELMYTTALERQEYKELPKGKYRAYL